ncbi:MAG: trypsin-like serine protease [Verrucomicrobiales bacterium]
MPLIPRKIILNSLVSGLWTFSLVNAPGIIIRDDLDDANYVVNDSDYPALVDLIERGDCIGTLIHESYLLTVAHCAADLDPDDSLNVNGIACSVAAIIPHPQWNKRHDEYDIALVRFSQPVKGVTPLPIYRGEDETGSLITLVGRGVTATGLTGERGARNDGKLRKCTNIVTGVDDHFIEIRFERPGENGITPLEGIGAAGDSGCPAFIEVNGAFYIAGLNSWGDGPRGVRVGQYGAFDYQTRVSQYLEWLESIVDFPDPPAPETTLQIMDVSAIRLGSGAVAGISLTFSTSSGKSYSIEQSHDMMDWQMVKRNIAGTGKPLTQSFPVATNNTGSMFLRARQK